MNPVSIGGYIQTSFLDYPGSAAAVVVRVTEGPRGRGAAQRIFSVVLDRPAEDLAVVATAADPAGITERRETVRLAFITALPALYQRSPDKAVAAQTVERAVLQVLDAGLRTADIVTPGEEKVGTRAMGSAIAAAVAG